MTDAWLMEADCVHGNVWYECKVCEIVSDDDNRLVPICERCGETIDQHSILHHLPIDMHDDYQEASFPGIIVTGLICPKPR